MSEVTSYYAKRETCGRRRRYLEGHTRKNEVAAAGSEIAGYQLNHATIELDTSEVGTLDEGLEGLPVNAEGHFEA